MSKAKRVTCPHQWHPGSNQEAENWCRIHHQPPKPYRPETLAAMAKAKGEIRTYPSDALGAITIPEDDRLPTTETYHFAPGQEHNQRARHNGTVEACPYKVCVARKRGRR